MAEFIYHGCEIEKDGFSFKFSLGEHEFRPKWTAELPEKIDEAAERMIFNLGMAESISYWKCACPREFVVRRGSLSEWQKSWWKKLFRLGLGEFFYKNNIAPDDGFIEFDADNDCEKFTCPHELSGSLIPVGGGKDSAVTLELLRESRGDNLCYIIGDIKRARDCAHVAGYPDSRIINPARSIDPRLLELNRRGFLNGHTPFSAIVAFSGVLFAYLHGKKYVPLSNESGANEANTSNGVNHQYSKSFEFESDFREYISREFAGAPEYFSLLRPLSEYKITELFTRFPRYFPVFQSCNAGVKTNSWCLKCAKCLYIYIMLAAFLDDDVLTGIFGANMLGDASLSGMLTELADPDLVKPFECVGTRDEVNYALHKALKRRPNPPLLLKNYADKIKLPDYDMEKYFDENNHVPPELVEKLIMNKEQ